MNVSLRSIAFCLAVTSLATLSAATATWTNTAANTPATAYDWSDSANWQDGKIGGAGDKVVLPADKVYIRVPAAGVTVHTLSGTSSAVLIGGDIRLHSTDAGARAVLATSAKIFCDIVIPSTETLQPHFSGDFNVCARIRNESASSNVYPIIANGSNEWFFRHFADSAGSERSDHVIDTGTFGFGSGALFFHAPDGTSQATGTWKLTAGSPYATRVSSPAHGLAVGTTVAGDGIPENTYLKRVFDDATIELSNPAAAAGDTELTFAGFTPDFSAKFADELRLTGEYIDLYFYKNRASDTARVEIPLLRMISTTGNGRIWLGNTTDSQPCGTFVFNKVNSGGKFKFIDLRSAHVEFAGDETGTTEFTADHPFEMQKALSSRLTVTNNVTGVISVLSNFNGRITKDGAGTLRLGLGVGVGNGSLVAGEGTLKLMNVAGAALTVKSLTIRAGATLELPEGGLNVGELVLEDGAVLKGDGVLTVLDGTDRTACDPRLLTCLGGASVAYTLGSGTTAAADIFEAGATVTVSADATLAAGSAASGSLVKDGEGKVRLDGFNATALDIRAGEVEISALDRASAVPAGAWIHVDADDGSTITTNATYSTRLEAWFDVNGTGRSLRNHRDISAISRCASITPDAINGRTAINLGPQTSGDSSILIYHNEEGEKSLNYNGNPTTMEAPKLKSALLVYDSSQGGGPLLGGLGGYIVDKGLLPRWETTSADSPIVCNMSTDPNAMKAVNAISNLCENGTAVFRRNGEVCNPAIAKFSKGPELVSFRHPDGRRSDTFGGYGTASAGNAMGGLMYGEIILFERELTDAETAFAEAYLAKKWLGLDTPGYGAPSATNLFVAAGATLTLTGDEPFTAKSIEGGGTVDGSLSLLSGGGITVDVAEDGSVDCLTVTGSADLSAGGTLTLTGAVSELAAGRHAVLSAATLLAGADWTVTGGETTRKYSVRAKEGELYLLMHQPGFGIILR